jgi:hypothetical protein
MFEDQNVSRAVIEEGVTTVFAYAFSGFRHLTSVSIPGSVKSIGERAFGSCSNLASVVIPGSVTSIGKGAFEHCGHPTSVHIPEGLLSIGSSAFSNCSSLTDVSAGWTEPPFIYEDVFGNAPLATLHVPAGTEALYRATDGWKRFGTIVAGAGAGLVSPSASPYVHCDRGILTVFSPQAGRISVYSVSSSLLYRTQKGAGAATFPIGHLPKGILIVKDSSGWAGKTMNNLQ